MRWRRGAAAGEQPTQPEDLAAEPRPKGYTPRKDRPTPRRDEAAPPGRPRGPVAPPPRTRREAYRRMREDSRSGRSDARQRIAAGDEAALGKRDRGPARRLTRDLVDSRRSPLTLFLPVFVVYAIAPFLPDTPQRILLLIVLAVFLVMMLDAVQLGRLISTTVPARVSGTTDKPRSLVLYGVLRATLPRRFRVPRPQVGVGQPV